jgi:hypothetical protein
MTVLKDPKHTVCFTKFKKKYFLHEYIFGNHLSSSAEFAPNWMKKIV